MSSFAGNEMLISPGNLILDGQLKASDCEADFAADVVDYEAVIPFKVRLLEIAWKNLNAGERKDLQPAVPKARVKGIDRNPTSPSMFSTYGSGGRLEDQTI